MRALLESITFDASLPGNKDNSDKSSHLRNLIRIFYSLLPTLIR